jgi:uncharacterized protein
MSHDFNAAILEDVVHRPWPMPDRPWVMTQTWRDLLFAHWPVDPEHLQAKVPPAFALDLFDGVAWIGVVPFRMTNVGPRGIPSLPGVSEFPELNVRTYVSAEGRPGVYFFSLDAGSALAVHAARKLLNLPYYLASMKVTPHGDGIDYQTRRDGANATAEFSARYGPTGPAFAAARESLEYFLTERYCLYHIDRRGGPYRLEIHHPRWDLQLADAEFDRNTMAEASGIALPGRPPLLHYVKRQDTVAWMPTSLE